MIEQSGHAPARDNASPPIEKRGQIRSPETTLRDLKSRLIAAQEQERRRIARDLHDGMGQTASLLKMNLDRLGKLTELNGEPAEILAQCTALAEAMTTEIRTISYLLHPPLLDELGFNSALRCLADGFSQRSGIAIQLRIDELPRLPYDVEICIYRIVQECLTNVHRHSGSSSAEVHVERRTGEIQIRIHDHGHGMTVETDGNYSGVGLGGMRERAAELGGRLEIVSGENGTAIIVNLPHPEAPSAKRATQD